MIWYGKVGGGSGSGLLWMDRSWGEAIHKLRRRDGVKSTDLGFVLIKGSLRATHPRYQMIFRSVFTCMMSAQSSYYAWNSWHRSSFEGGNKRCDPLTWNAVHSNRSAKPYRDSICSYPTKQKFPTHYHGNSWYTVIFFQQAQNVERSKKILVSQLSILPTTGQTTVERRETLLGLTVWQPSDNSSRVLKQVSQSRCLRLERPNYSTPAFLRSALTINLILCFNHNAA